MPQATESNLIQAICHDSREFINGSVTRFSEGGCELVSLEHSPGPRFPENCWILVNLVHEGKRQSVSLNAKLTRVFRQDGAWHYRLKWKPVAELAAWSDSGGNEKEAAGDAEGAEIGALKAA